METQTGPVVIDPLNQQLQRPEYLALDALAQLEVHALRRLLRFALEPFHGRDENRHQILGQTVTPEPVC